MRRLCARRPRSNVHILAFLLALFAAANLGVGACAQEFTATAGAHLRSIPETSNVAPAGPKDPKADLPDAPSPVHADEADSTPAYSFAAGPAPDSLTRESSSLAPNLDFLEADGGFVSTRGTARNPEMVPLNECPTDTSHARECRVHWGHLMATTSIFNAFQNAGNLYTGYWYRYETTHGKWFDRWIDSAAGWDWTRWSDQNGFVDDYIGHPMMGAITNSLWIQDDPKAMTVEFGNTPEYWRSRTRALIFSTAYSFEWKLGPFGEAGIGHNGDHLIPEIHGPKTNETGWVDLVTTPVGGLIWTMAEDVLDKHVVKPFEQRPRGPFALLAISFLTPARATANIFRFRPPWYRDGRVVKANSFWSEPPGPDEDKLEPGVEPNEELANAEPHAAEGGGVTPVREREPLPVWPHYGGTHEFGAWWGLSMVSGPIWGYAKDIYYMPVDVNYSYLLNPHSTRWNFRYAPEVTALAMLDEPHTVPPKILNPFLYHRKRTYGSGLSPVGFRASFAPQSRVQPFLSTDGGFIYFADRVLSPQGSQFMYTIDFGGGVTIYRKKRQSISFGYRYQHLSNANISLHNPGTDANTFYFAVSRYRTKGYR
jgi:hypothetical protein